MIGLVNAVGVGSSIGSTGADAGNAVLRHGIQVPIPTPQREAKADSTSAVFPLRRDDDPHEKTNAPQTERHAPRPASHALPGTCPCSDTNKLTLKLGLRTRTGRSACPEAA